MLIVISVLPELISGFRQCTQNIIGRASRPFSVMVTSAKDRFYHRLRRNYRCRDFRLVDVPASTAHY